MIPWKHVVGVIGQTWSRASPLRGLLNSLRGASNSFTMIILISLYLRIYISYHTTPLLQAILHQLPHSRLLDVNPSALGSLSDCAWSKHGCLTPWPSNFQSSLCAELPSNSPPSLRRTCSLSLKHCAGLTLTGWLSPSHPSGLRWPIICLGKSRRFLGSWSTLRPPPP